MPEETRFCLLSRDRLTFFQEFLKHPLQTRSVIPGSRFPGQHLRKSSDFKSMHGLAAPDVVIARILLSATEFSNIPPMRVFRREKQVV